MKIIALLTLLFLYAGDSPSFRLTASPRTGFAPVDVEIRLYLNGTERAAVVSLYDSGFLSRSSGQELNGEKLVYIKWRRVGPCDPCQLIAIVEDSKGQKGTKSLDLHYIGM